MLLFFVSASRLHLWDLLRNLNIVHTHDSGAYFPHHPLPCIPLFYVYPSSSCVYVLLVCILPLWVRIVRTEELAPTSLITRLEKESSPPWYIPLLWMYILPQPRTPPSLFHVYPSTVCVTCVLFLLQQGDTLEMWRQNRLESQQSAKAASKKVKAEAKKVAEKSMKPRKDDVLELSSL